MSWPQRKSWRRLRKDRPGQEGIGQATGGQLPREKAKSALFLNLCRNHFSLLECCLAGYRANEARSWWSQVFSSTFLQVFSHTFPKGRLLSMQIHRDALMLNYWIWEAFVILQGMFCSCLAAHIVQIKQNLHFEDIFFFNHLYFIK